MSKKAAYPEERGFCRRQFLIIITIPFIDHENISSCITTSAQFLCVSNMAGKEVVNKKARTETDSVISCSEELNKKLPNGQQPESLLRLLSKTTVIAILDRALPGSKCLLVSIKNPCEAMSVLKF